MAIHTMIELQSWHNKTIFKAGDGRMAIHTMIELQSWYNVDTEVHCVNF